MKLRKRSVALILILTMLFTMSIPAYADGPQTGKLTIQNAQKGSTYTLYKIFDATTDGTPDHVTYTINEPESISGTLFEKVISSGSPFDLQPAYAADDGIDLYTVVLKEGKNKDDVSEFIGGLTAATYFVKGASQKAETGDPLVFSNVPYGYYYVDTTTGANFSIDTVNTDVTIIDKNPVNPTIVEKSTKELAVEVGKEVEYDIEFMALNYVVTQSDAGEPVNRIITSYYIEDTYEGLEPSGKTPVVEIYADAGYQDKIETLTEADWDGSFATGNHTFSYDVSKTKENTQFFSIPWVKASPSVAKNEDNEDVTYYEYTQLYDSPVWVKITYTMIATADMTEETAGNAAPNTASGNYTYVPDTVDQPNPNPPYPPEDEDTPPGDVPPENWPPKTPPEKFGEDYEVVFTLGTNVDKIDAQTKAALSGSEFRIYRLTPSDAEKPSKEYYSWNENEKKVEWVTDETQAAVIKPDNTDSVEVKSLEPGNYKLEEIKAPNGYNLPKEPFDLKVEAITKDAFDEATEEYKTYDELKGNEPVIYTVTVTGPNMEPATIEVDNSRIADLDIANNPGSPLPTTGGLGTTLLIVIGSIMFMGTALVLISKKRLYNEI